MTEIWNLSAICRCCHVDGNFKSLEVPHPYQNTVEVYSVMLQETFGVEILKPTKHGSYSICDECIAKLRDAVNFKFQITLCEQKFKEYLLNEEALNPKDIKVELEYNDPTNRSSVILEVPTVEIKHEVDNDSDNGHCDAFEDNVDLKPDVIKKEEADIKIASEKKIHSEVKVKKTKQKTEKKKVKRTSKQTAQKAKPKKQSSESSSPETKAYSRTCKKCLIRFNSRAECNAHFNAHHKKRGPFKCPDCAQENEKFKDMLEHMKMHGQTRVKCRFCVKTFPFRNYLINHENTVHGKGYIYICDYCNKQFRDRTTLAKHFLWHAGLNKRHFCETCGHGFNDKANLKKHIDAVHLQLRNFLCSQCDGTFKAKKHLKRHIAIKHEGVEYGDYLCKLCPAKFDSLKRFRDHNKTEHADQLVEGKAAYFCKGCPETFMDRGKFRSHVMKHNKEGTLPHICHICGLSFSYKYSLNRHLDIHQGLKPYVCDICQKAFTQGTQLSRHKNNVHNPEKKEKITKCPICKQNVRDLEKHKRVHIDRPFACEECHKSYPEKNALNRHIRQFHFGIYKHNCEVCHTRYKTARLLDKHNKKCHGKKTELPVELEET